MLKFDFGALRRGSRNLARSAKDADFFNSLLGPDWSKCVKRGLGLALTHNHLIVFQKYLQLVHAPAKDRSAMPSLPYISSPGNIEKALNGIKAAAVPDRVSQDFVKTVLQIPSGSGDQMTAFLKKLDFASSDGTPTNTYTRFRNPTTSGPAIAAAIRHAYARLYVRNEYMHNLSDNDLQGLIVEETGQAHDSLSVKRTLACINALKKHANFVTSLEVPVVEPPPGSSPTNPQNFNSMNSSQISGSVGLNLGYTININLPATTEQSVFNAIFKSLKEHLLRDDDA